ncbi:MAG: HEPN domain-containing protein [Clostridiales Family XIII bacterium]|jgi:HEPN domain-containing protein|nr:HEPN domain-containing protein [Clostridiales Family XIII bacterium]
MDPDFAYEWFQYADTDLLSAEHLLTLHPRPFELICYLSEQSAEKFLKGYLVHKGMEQPPKIHELNRLCALCLQYDERFAEIEKQCNVLTDYGVQPRYPHEMLIEEHHMEQALDYNRQIRDFEPIQAAKREIEQELEKNLESKSEQGT